MRPAATAACALRTTGASRSDPAAISISDLGRATLAGAPGEGSGSEDGGGGSAELYSKRRSTAEMCRFSERFVGEFLTIFL